MLHHYRLVGTRAYLAIEVIELVVLLGVVDAAYSGDWSRIGALTKDTELLLQKVVLIIAAGHTLTGIAAGVVAHSRGVNWAVPAAKGFLFGALGLYEQTSQLNKQ
eukprot:jgi/Chrzof1/13187/Cz07g23110.t1